MFKMSCLILWVVVLVKCKIQLEYPKEYCFKSKRRLWATALSTDSSLAAQGPFLIHDMQVPLAVSMPALWPWRVPQPRPGELPTCALEPISNVACLVLAPQQPSRMVGESLTWDWISLGGWGGTSLWRGDAPQRETAPKALELSQHWAPGQRRKSTWQLKRQSQGLSQGEYQKGYKSIFRRMQRRFECGKKWMGRGLAEQEKLEWKWGRKLGE